MVLRSKPPNPLASSVLHTRPPPLDMCHRRPRPADRQVLWAPLNLHVLRLDSVNTVTSMYTCAYRCPRCQPLRPITRPPGLSVQVSCSSFTAPGPSARHVFTWLSPRRRPPPPSSTLPHHKPRDMSHNPTHTMVRSQTQHRSWIILTITHHNSNHKGTCQPCVRKLTSMLTCVLSVSVWDCSTPVFAALL
jgi:hypothetical protein